MDAAVRVQAYRIAEHKDVRLPIMICQDGFITSHAVENIELLEDDIITFENTGNARTVYQYDKKGKFLAEYSSTGEAARKNFPEFKRASSHIGECCRRRIKTYKNFIWRYKDDIV